VSDTLAVAKATFPELPSFALKVPEPWGSGGDAMAKDYGRS